MGRERERERSQIDPHPPPPGEFQYVFSLASQIRFLFFKNFSFRFSCGFEFFYNKMEANQHLSEIIKAWLTRMIINYKDEPMLSPKGAWAPPGPKNNFFEQVKFSKKKKKKRKGLGPPKFLAQAPSQNIMNPPNPSSS